MKKQPAYLYVSVLLGTLTQPIFATPIDAVIGLSNSQIVENNPTISLSPISGTLLPLQDNFAPITHLQNDSSTNWINEVGQEVRVEHKQRDLSYTGTLTQIQQNNRTMWLSINGRLTQLPLDDFYLIPLTKSEPQKNATALTFPVSYQTNQLSWSPQLSLIFENGQVTLSQQALLSNHSNTQIDIRKSLLHYSNNISPQRFKIERSSLAMGDMKQEVNYQDNEISYPLKENALSISPYSNTLIPLPSSNSEIDKQVQQASLYTYGNSSGKIDLTFNNTVHFSLPKDGFPGVYKTFWKKEGLLIPGNEITLNTVRANNPLTVTTNKSQDVTGYLTLVSSTSEKLPTTQVWTATIENHSDKAQHYSVEHSTNSLVELLAGDAATQTNAKGINLSGNIEANSTKTVTYKIELKN
ncbi:MULTISPECIES: hypothetical protein [Marinomonas]|uniref:DUF4139 domain-containing protein n=1 Tax=Marinomonas alcarazii TaxID=491949 RepID=A0A318V9P3_9GAMM|nr:MULTISPECIES: hypothetical protein [Marinomonas]PYF84238.1 hypothetical protein DFP75_101263 [Marinomonas alcarazii]